jgi:hypothetical protein
MDDRKAAAANNSPAAAAPPASKTITLPSGKVATIREGTGADIMRSRRVLDEKLMTDPTANVFSLMAQTVQIDGRPIVFEDVLAMKASDIIALEKEVLGENFVSPPTPRSRDSSASDSPPKS